MRQLAGIIGRHMQLTRARGAGALLMLSSIAISACGDATAAPTPTPSPRPKAATPSPPPGRPAPLIVQIENSPDSRPQSGLSNANTIYEYVSEGGITRFSAIFATPPPVRIGPVRSARLATLELLRFYQGVLVYSGASIYINGLLEQSPQRHHDEDHGFGDLFRIAARVPPHNLYTDGSHLTDLLRRTAAAPVSYQPALLGEAASPVGGTSPRAAGGKGAAPATSAAWLPPTPSSTATAPSSGLAPGRGSSLGAGATAPVLSRPAASFSVPISYREEPSFTWDVALGGWTRREATGTLIDENTEAPVLPRTVIVQQVDVRTAPEVHDVLGELGVRHTMLGAGSAQIFSNGTEYDATWTQPALGPAHYTLPGGAPAPIGPGLVWVCLVPTGSPATVR